ncbi:unnamed protein product [Trichobilharzia szidati]|nr:unnamed protein product [Trichobilharzia szidati]
MKPNIHCLLTYTDYFSDFNYEKDYFHSNSFRNSHADFLNFIKCSTIHSICAVDAGKFEQISDNHDLLIIGSKTGVLLYDPKNNIDIFYKELKNDGVNTIVYKHFEQQEQQQQRQRQLSHQKYKDSDVILVGGNCTLTILNYSGLELFWTVTGEAISSLTCLSYENTEEYFNDIIIGSEDYSIRVFRGDLIVHEISETDVVTKLVSLGGEYFGYGLNNGTIGVYNRTSRVWRIKVCDYSIMNHHYYVQ